MELAPPTRLFALIDTERSPGSEEGSGDDFSLVRVHLSGQLLPPWQVDGLNKGGGIGPIQRFETLAEAKTFAEERFPARGPWQPEPAQPRSGGYLRDLLPEHTDWRVKNLGEAFQGAVLTWTRFSSEIGDDENCRGCWANFMDVDHIPYFHRSGFVKSPDEWLCEGCYHDLKEYLRFRTLLP
jgi:hypothetical protein